jgi:hypothetical protein
LRSGNTFIVTGDLITGLTFTVDGAMMGQTLSTDREKVTVEIKVRDPDVSNFNTYSDYTNPELDHFDLIAGQVTGRISPDDPEYEKDHVSTTCVIARFDASGGLKDDSGLESQKWEDLGDGWKKITYQLVVQGNMYVRLRGTNHHPGTPEESDGAGNPLPDIAEENSAAKAFSDLWFYSNPVFIHTVLDSVSP